MQTRPLPCALAVFFFNDTATTEIYTLSLHDALPIWTPLPGGKSLSPRPARNRRRGRSRSEEHTSELQSRQYLVCRLLLEKRVTGRTPFPRPHRGEAVCPFSRRRMLRLRRKKDRCLRLSLVFFLHDPATPKLRTLPQPDALPI